MKKWLLFLSFISLTALPANEVANADWSKSSGGMLKNWKVRPAEEGVFSAQNGILHLKSRNPKQAVLAIQENLPLKPGSVYQAECRIRSNSKSDVMFYIEYRNSAGRLVAANGVWRKTIPAWERHRFNIRVPEKIQGKPYIVLRPAVGGEAEFTGLSVKELATPQDIPLLGGVMHAVVRSSDPAVISLEDTPGKQVAAEHRNVPITPGKSCVYNFSIRGEGVSGHNTGFHFYRVEVILPDGTLLTPGWDDTWNDRKQFKTIKFIVPEKPENRSMTVRFYANSQGKLVLEDFKVACKEIDPAENYYFVLDSPISRDTFYGSSADMVCRGKVHAYAAPAADTVQIKAADGSVIKTSAVNWNGSLTADFALALGTLPEGAYTLQLMQNKNVLIERNIKVLPVSKNMVTSSNYNQVLLNGKPFFVNLMWWNPGYGSNPAALEQLAANGITVSIVAGGNSTSLLRGLDNFEQAGLKAVVNLTLSYWIKTKGHVPTEDFISGLLSDEVKNHPALLGYLLIDEPMWGGVPVEPLLKSYGKLREVDPYHPVWINAAPRGEVAGHRIYSGAADWYGLDIYPVPAPNNHSNLEDQNLTSVGKYTLRMVEAVNAHKPVIMTLQAFSWNSLANRKVKDFKGSKGYPTVEELRFMSFDAFTSGAVGLAWWGSHYVRKADFIADFMQVQREHYALSGILAGGERSQRVEKNGLRYCNYTLNGCTLYAVLNISDRTQTAVLPAFENGKALDFYGKCEAASGSKVKLAPYTVKIYVSGQLPAPAYELPVTGAAPTEFIKHIK
ncbi:MAG: hypothetical protein E7047_01880 [Lentisphaerae bacterium]|nr:hypothetical protein [Lentisphaerota bacterium]